MIWSNYNTNNEKGLLKFNGPYRGRTYDGSFFNGPYWRHTYDGSFTGVQHPQVIEMTKSIKVGEIKIYGTATISYNTEKEEQNEIW
jgi:hypothetical protein